MLWQTFQRIQQRRQERRRQGRNPRQPPAQDESLRNETRLEFDLETEALRDEALEWDLDGVLEDARDVDLLLVYGETT